MLYTLETHGSGPSDREALVEAVGKSNRVLGAIAYLNEKQAITQTAIVLPVARAGLHAVSLLTTLSAPQSICQALDRQRAELELEEPATSPEEQPQAWLFADGRFTRIPDPCSYPTNWTVDTYRAALVAQGYRREGDLFGLDRLRSPDFDEIALAFEVFAAAAPGEEEERQEAAPCYPYRVEACLFQSDSEPPIYVPDYPSLLQLAASFAPLVRAKLAVLERAGSWQGGERDTPAGALRLESLTDL
jgi:hypothetical protein